MRIFLALLVFTSMHLKVFSDYNGDCVGVLAYSEYKGDLNPEVYKFDSISWISVANAQIRDKEGRIKTLDCSKIHCIVFFDEKFYKTLGKYSQFRRVSTEYLFPSYYPANYTPLTAETTNESILVSISSCKSLIDSYPKLKPILSDYINYLNSESEMYKKGFRKVERKWFNPLQYAEITFLKDEMPTSVENEDHIRIYQKRSEDLHELFKFYPEAKQKLSSHLFEVDETLSKYKSGWRLVNKRWFSPEEYKQHGLNGKIDTFASEINNYSLKATLDFYKETYPTADSQNQHRISGIVFEKIQNVFASSPTSYYKSEEMIKSIYPLSKDQEYEILQNIYNSSQDNWEIMEETVSRFSKLNLIEANRIVASWKESNEEIAEITATALSIIASPEHKQFIAPNTITDITAADSSIIKKLESLEQKINTCISLSDKACFTMRLQLLNNAIEIVKQISPARLFVVNNKYDEAIAHLNTLSETLKNTHSPDLDASVKSAISSNYDVVSNQILEYSKYIQIANENEKLHKNSKAVEAYEKAYDLIKNENILQKIENLKKGALGI